MVFFALLLKKFGDAMFGGTTEAPCPMTMVSQTKTWPFISLRNWKNGGVVLSWRMKRHRQTASPFLPGSAHSVARKHTWLHAPPALGEIGLNIGRSLGKDHPANFTTRGKYYCSGEKWENGAPYALDLHSLVEAKKTWAEENSAWVS